MANKNAYEIRTEVLKEANSNCWNRYYQRVEAARLKRLDQHFENPEDRVATGDYISEIDQPTATDVVAEAEALYSFINYDK